MSTIISNLRTIVLGNANMLEMSMKNVLADYVSATMREKNLSGYDVERASRRQITQTYINRIKNGEVPHPSATKLTALAMGLGVPEHEVFAAVRGLDPHAALTNERLGSIDRL
jgi:transcriptional regulator with XRE-family HTH domain